MSFKDKVVIVTGASSGIGAAVAIAFSKEGARVVIVGRNEVKMAATAALCTDPLVIRADVTKDDDVRGIIDKTVQKFEKIDILINNIGAAVPRSILEENIMEVYDAVMNVNLRAAFFLTSLTIPHLIKTKGNIINICSISANSTFLGSKFIVYSISKAGMKHFGACLAADLAPYGVRVNTISPGFVRTDFIENSGHEESWDNLSGLTPLGKVCEAQEIADLVLFVAGSKAKSITGSNYVCDNGSLIKCTI